MSKGRSGSAALSGLLTNDHSPATRAGALDWAGREALLRYVLRPPVAQERGEPRADGLVRIPLKKAYTDGTIAVDMGPAVAVPAGHQRAPAVGCTPCATPACWRANAGKSRRPW